MKFYQTTLFILFLVITASYGQNSAVDQDNSDIPKLNTKSLQIETSVEVYPNPASDFINITLKNSKLEKVEIEMYNIIGNKVDFEMEQVNSYNYKANVKNLQSGYYLLVIKDQVNRFNKAYKFRKE
jgi:hypothetical protein